MKIQKFNSSFIGGVYEIVPEIFRDKRGEFTKIFHTEFFEQNNLNTHWKEQYYSLSTKDVIRGMHFQTPPFDHDKLVTCVQGTVIDVVLDLRKSSPTYGLFDQFELNSRLGNSLYIPKGCAHGFLVKSDTALLLYNVSTIFNADSDSGIRWNSFGMNWPTNTPIISEKDENLPDLKSFITPF